MPLPLFLENALYTSRPLPKRSPRSVPMEVLCVGPSRSGTDSLRAALEQLGYANPYHGFVAMLPPDGAADFRLITYLNRRKYGTQGSATRRGDGEAHLSRDLFDDLLGASGAATDLLAAQWAPELLAAYPDAKVVLNRRRDVDRWYESFDETLGGFERAWTPRSCVAWCKKWFSEDLYWTWELMTEGSIPDFFHGSFKANGKWKYREHEAMVRGLMIGREDRFLEWSVEEGWEPLCRFLGKEVPDAPFPKGNTPEGYEKRLLPFLVAAHTKALRNMAITAACLVVLVSWVIWRARAE